MSRKEKCPCRKETRKKSHRRHRDYSETSCTDIVSYRKRPCSYSSCRSGCCNGLSNCSFFIPSYVNNCYNYCGPTASGSCLYIRPDFCCGTGWGTGWGGGCGPCGPSTCCYESCYNGCCNGYTSCTFVKSWGGGCGPWNSGCGPCAPSTCCYESCYNGCCNGYTTCTFVKSWGGGCGPCGYGYGGGCGPCGYGGSYGWGGGCGPCGGYRGWDSNCKPDCCPPKKECKDVNANLTIVSVDPNPGIPGDPNVYTYTLNLTNTGSSHLKGTLMVSVIASATYSSFNIGDLAPGSVQTFTFLANSTSGNPPALQAYISFCGRNIGVLVSPVPPVAVP